MMLTERMKEHKLLTGAWWVPLPGSSHTLRTRAVRGLLERQCHAVSYEVDGNQEGPGARTLRGLMTRHSSDQEPLALYIRLLYGDGIFYSPARDGMVWLLIVHEGVIVPGTDCLLSPLVFDRLMEERKFSPYRTLQVRQLSEECGQAILPHYQANQRRLKKKRYVLYGALVCIGLVLLAIPAAFIMTV